jgi:DNA (cytosine-5)-methyltransferase 1
MLRAIREIQPRWVVGENVFGLINWSDGLVFHEVQADLEAAGYEVWPYVLPACAVNAPHRRDRVWFIAYNATYANGNGQHGSDGNNEKHTSKGGKYALNDINEVAMHTNGTSKQGKHIRQTREGKFNGPDSGNGFNNFQNFPTQPPICGGNDGLPTELDGITFPKWRNESIKAYGNAIVPQVAYEIFKAINQYNNQ